MRHWTALLLSVIFALLTSTCFADNTIVCRFGSRIHIVDGETPPTCDPGTEPPPSAILEPGHAYSGIGFPPSNNAGRSCMVSDFITPPNWQLGWVPTLSLDVIRVPPEGTVGDGTEKVNFTAAVTYHQHYGAQDIRNSRYGAKKKVDVSPTGTDNVPPFSPYSLSIRDIPSYGNPAGTGAQKYNAPAARKFGQIMLCREGPGDDSQSKWRVINANLRWESSQGPPPVVEEQDYIGLTSSYPENNDALLEDGVANSVPGWDTSDSRWKPAYLQITDPLLLLVNAVQNLCSIGTTTYYPNCGADVHQFFDLHPAVVDCIQFRTAVPTDIAPDVPVKFELIFKPEMSDGYFKFEAKTAFTDTASLLTVPPTFSPATASRVFSCGAGKQMSAVFDSINMAQAAPGKIMIIQVCRLGNTTDDTSNGVASVFAGKVGLTRSIKVKLVTE